MLEKLKLVAKITGFGVTTTVGAIGIGKTVKTIVEIMNNKGDDELEIEISEDDDYDDDDFEEEEIEE